MRDKVRHVQTIASRDKQTTKNKLREEIIEEFKKKIKVSGLF